HVAGPAGGASTVRVGREDDRARVGAPDVPARGIVDDALLARVRERLAGTVGPPSPQAIAAAVRAESQGVIGDADMLVALRELETELVGAGLLAPLLTDPEVTDVLVNAPDE